MSFSPAGARLSDGARFAAYTIVATARPGTDIRLSSDGRPDPDELARVRRVSGELPAVEIVELAGTPRLAASIPGASLVGWIGERGVLAVRNGSLVVYDETGTKQRETGIRVRTAAAVFLR